jgi:hypothetical protein
MTTPTLHPGYRWSTDYATMADLMEQGHVLLCQTVEHDGSWGIPPRLCSAKASSGFWNVGYWNGRASCGACTRDGFVWLLTDRNTLRWLVPPGVYTTDHPAPDTPEIP